MLAGDFANVKARDRVEANIHQWLMSLRGSGRRSIAYAALAIIAMLLLSPAAEAQGYAIGQKVMCDATDLNKYYKPGVIIPFHDGETFNGEPAGGGYFYRVKFDDPAFDESPCKVTSMRPAQTAQSAVSSARPVQAAQSAGPVANGDKTFGARAPTPCPPLVRARPTMTQIRALVLCRLEGTRSSLLYLAANLTIEAGATRPYNYNADSFNSSIDPAAPVLPLRGSYIRYQCSPVAENPPGRNCTTNPEMHAYGECYRTTFGNWDCNLQGNDNDLSQTRFHQPPPR